MLRTRRSRKCEVGLRLAVSLPLACLVVAFIGCPVSAQEATFELENEVVVTYDVYGVPHIKASSEKDLYFAQGYVTAKDRLWQMEYSRRYASGRLAEIAGPEYLERDFFTHLIGLHRAAQGTYFHLDQQTKEILLAFSVGVNYYIDTHKDNLPEEFQRLDYQPEPWTPVDTLVIVGRLAWILSGSLEEEVRLAQLIERIGPEKALELATGEAADPLTHTTWQEAASLLPPEIGREDLEILAMTAHSEAPASPQWFIGSNNWVIDGEKSATGYPLLANDPHLELSNPAIWYEVHLECPGLNVIGGTFPGAPGVIIGHNDRIAWGMTNVGYDVGDVYVEQLNPEDPSMYLFRGQYMPFRRREVTLKFRTEEGVKSTTRTIRSTLHGPVIQENLGDKVLTFKWLGQFHTTPVRPLYLMNRAQNLDEFKEALKYFHIPAQNIIYADVEGNIFCQPTGKVPIRDGVPYLPLDGSSGEYEWAGFIPYDELPKAENPAEHFIATANARPVDKAYPYYIGRSFAPGFRLRRIVDRLTAEDKISFAEMQSIQADVHSVVAERLKPQLLKAAKDKRSALSRRSRKALRYLEAWDNQTSVDSVGSAVFHKWLEKMAVNTLKDDLSEEDLAFWGNYPPTVILLLLRAEQGSLEFDWFDDSSTRKTETKADIIVKSLNDACKELKNTLGKDVEEWTWGKLHTLTLKHALFDDLSVGPFPLDGSINTVDNAGFMFFRKDYATGSGPSMRMVVELKAGVGHAENVIPGGQSGIAGDEHYMDLMKTLWIHNKAHPMLFTEEEISENAQKILRLRPEGT